FDFDHRRSGEIAASDELMPDGFENRRVGMAQPDGTVTHAVFDVFAAVDVPYATAQPAHDERRRLDRVLIVSLRICVAAARDEGVRPCLKHRRSLGAGTGRSQTVVGGQCRELAYGRKLCCPFGPGRRLTCCGCCHDSITEGCGFFRNLVRAAASAPASKPAKPICKWRYTSRQIQSSA